MQSASGRREERVDTELPVSFDSGAGIARNVSASGIYFETDARLAPGSAIQLCVVFSDSPSGPLRLHCEARVLRIEEKGNKVGVGACISNFKFKRLGAES